MVEINRTTLQRYSRGEHTGDFVQRSATGDDFFDKEDKVVMGTFVDEESSGTKSKFSIMFAGVANKLEGTNANLLDDADDYSRTDRGNRSSTHRQARQDFYFD